MEYLLAFAALLSVGWLIVYPYYQAYLRRQRLKLRRQRSGGRFPI